MDSASLGGDTVIEHVKKRVSKWDLVADPPFPTETVKNNYKSGDAADAHHDKDFSSGGNLSKSAGSQVSKWSDLEAGHKLRSKDSSGGTSWEPLPEGKGEGKDGSVGRDGEKISPTAKTWGGDQSYGSSIAPRVDAWRQRSRSRSPKSGWGRPRRSRSRSPHGFKHEAEGWTDRGRSGRGESIVPCRDFAVGRCRRGGQCRYLHQDGRDYDDRGHFDSGPEDRGRRQEKGGFSRYASDEAFIDSQEQSGYSREKILLEYEDHNEGDREKHEPQRNSRLTARCNDFLKGKCYRGSACKYVHHGVNTDDYGGWPSKDVTRERPHNRREDTSFGHDQRREPHRSSDILCRYFVEGRCRNGERCRYSHQVSAHGSPEGKSRDVGWGDSSIMGNRSWEGPKLSDKDRAGVDCPENQSWNGPKWGDETGDRKLSSNQSWDGPKCGDKEADKDVSSSHWSSDTNNTRPDHPGNRSWEVPNWSDKAAETNISKSPQWTKNDDGTRGSAPESRTADKFRTVADVVSAGANREGYPQNMGRKESVYNLQYSESQNPEAEGQHQHVSTTLTQPVASENVYNQQHPGLKADAAVFPCEERDKFINSAGLRNEINLLGNNVPVIVPAVESGQNQLTFLPPASAAQSSNPNEQNQLIAFPPNFQNLNPDRQNQVIISPPPNVQNFNPSGKTQQIIPPLSSGQNVNFKVQSQPMVPPLLSGQTDPIVQSQQLIMQPPSTAQSQILLGQVESSKKPDLLDANMPQHTSEIPVPQNAVTTEQGTQMTDLSASLAQIFGNGQQLPQLYATLNHLSATGLVPSHQYSQSNSVRPSAPMEAPVIHPNQGPWPQKHYDPIQGSTESVNPDISNQPPMFPVNTHEQNSTSFQQLQAPQQILAPSSVTTRPNEDGSPKIDSLDKSNHENQYKQHELDMDTEAVEVNEAATIQCQKDQQTSHLKDLDADDQVDEEGKRGKDAKAMRMFKFALVEFVKELLKPTWKEGHMSKEVHKTIVKKVVDKVTVAMQGPNIPQTQEKIDHYLSYSKPKLTKLVHAYVEKYLKT